MFAPTALWGAKMKDNESANGAAPNNAVQRLYQSGLYCQHAIQFSGTRMTIISLKPVSTQAMEFCAQLDTVFQLHRATTDVH
jgi:hypothetical protein